MASTSLDKSLLRSEKQFSQPSGNTRNNASSVNPHVRPKVVTVPSSKRSVTPNSKVSTAINDSAEGARVRVAVRVQPRSAEDLNSDADFADCVELQPELKRLKLRKNNWSLESYKFDEVFTEQASQKRVYEVVAKPVVESVLNGYNGTVMAYGQTGTGKTYTVGRIGKDDPSERGIMVRAVEEVLANASPEFDTVEVSYLQLYLESIQDLLVPEKNNIPIVEDPKTGEVSLPGATVVKLRDLDKFLQLMQVGEANRHAANTKMNTKSSRSHAILMVYVRRSFPEKMENEVFACKRDKRNDILNCTTGSTLLKSKLLVVDLAGSERLDKSGSEGHMLEEARSINLSLTSLGKCINAVAENSSYIPTRESKLTRLLRDSFGGSARTSLIVTISPSARNHAETASTIMFGQRAMKIVNMIKLKEEFDYESLCRKLENQVDYLTAETERYKKLREADRETMEKKLKECHNSFSEAESSFVARSEYLERENNRLEMEIKDLLNGLNLQKDCNKLMGNEVARLELSLNQSKLNDLEISAYQRMLADITQMYEKKIAELNEKLEDEHAHSESAQKQLAETRKLLHDCQTSPQLEKNNDQLEMKLQEMYRLQEKTTHELQSLKTENGDLLAEKIQAERKINEFEMKLKEIYQLHEQTLREFQSLKSAHEILFSEKIENQKEISTLRIKLEEISQCYEKVVIKLHSIESDTEELLLEKEKLNDELHVTCQKLSAEEKQRKDLEDECAQLKKLVLENDNGFEDKNAYDTKNVSKVPSEFANIMGLLKAHQPREFVSRQGATIAKIVEEVGLQTLIAMLSSEDLEVQIHAVKVIANLAAEDSNQDKIVEEGGLHALLLLLESSRNATIHRVASGAVANLAMNDMNQILIVSKGGVQLLANIASKTDDSQTLRMVAGAIANLCGNQKLHLMLKEDGGIKALLVMARSGNNDVIAQVARGIANFAKCESRATIQGYRKGTSLLMEDGVLSWLIANSVIASASTRRHIELALCHLAQNEDNVKGFISSGALEELVRISCESSREDIRSLAKKTVKSTPFQAVMQNAINQNV